MARRTRKPGARPADRARPLQRHLLGTMFDPTKTLERVLSTGTVVRIRVEEIDSTAMMVHEARKRRGDGAWVRWAEFEGVQSPERLCLDRWTRVHDT